MQIEKVLPEFMTTCIIIVLLLLTYCLADTNIANGPGHYEDKDLQLLTLGTVKVSMKAGSSQYAKVQLFDSKQFCMILNCFCAR